jgi:hypothetical protein
MTPVVNGLEESYKNQIEFRWLDANSADGNAIFRNYQLLGHPSYVILNPQGEILWKGFGEQPASDLEDQINNALSGS